ncbi:Heavy-metal-associated domain-containing protein [Carex littledalei]|uniref:Heavy-metal-associated domain-containing protein n=1 Tax=Carex littledalei TaxID=544730 RepID=A0A833RLZ5_9POAL|nr:Heavy-metal-associated domain-containing protein [Carex littledalei]
MKQEIVIKVQMRCDKCRTKAMELVASADGINSVTLAGEDRNQLVVVGDGVDAVSLASILRKKVGPTDIIKVGEAPNKTGNGKKNGKNEKKGDGDEKKEKSKGSEKEQKESKDSEKKDGKKDENGKHKEQQYQYNQNQYQNQYQYQYQNEYQYQGPKMEYVQEQQQWYPGYPAYPPVVVYDSPSYSNPNCSIM